MASDVRAGGAFVELLLKTAGFNKKLGNAGKSLTKFGAGVVASVLGPMAAAVKIFASAGDELNKMAARTGVSVEALGQLKFAAQQSGTSIESVEKAIRGMSRQILDAERGLSTATDNLDDLGVSLADLQELNPEEQFELFAARIAAVEDPSRRAALAMKIFGKSGADLLPMLADGVEGMNKLRQEAVELGIVLSEEDATAAAALTDALARITEQLKAVVVQLGAAIAGPLTDFANQLKTDVALVIAWIKQNRELIVQIAKIGVIVGTLGGVILTFGLTMQGLALAIGGATAAVKGLFVAFNLLVAHPVIAALAVIAAAVVFLANEYAEATDAVTGFDRALNKLKGKRTVGDPGQLQQMIKRFEQLSNKQKLSNAEIKEARKLAHDLRVEFGELDAALVSSKGISNAGRLRAQLQAAQGGRSRFRIIEDIGLSERSLEVRKAEGADAAEIERRSAALAKLNDELALQGRIVADARAIKGPAALVLVGTPPEIEKAGKEAGSVFGDAFKKGFLGLGELLGGASNDIAAAVEAGVGALAGLATPATPQIDGEAMRREIFTTFSLAALSAQVGRPEDKAAKSVDNLESNQKKRHRQLLAAVREGGTIGR